MLSSQLDGSAYIATHSMPMQAIGDNFGVRTNAFRINALDRNTGAQSQFVVDVDTEKEALDIAADQGLVVESIQKLRPKRKTAQKTPQPNRDPTTSRYPNLFKYLQWAENGARLGLYLLLAIAVVVSVFAIYDYFDSSYGDLSQLVISQIMVVLIAFFGYLHFVVTMAGIELIYVVVDIEANTRP